MTAAPEALTAVERATQVIEAALPRDGAWHPAGELHRRAAAAGIGPRTLQRAAAGLELDRRRAPGFGAGCEWRWPSGPSTREALRGERARLRAWERDLQQRTAALERIEHLRRAEVLDGLARRLGVPAVRVRRDDREPRG